jgi:hypothetical protein
MQTKVYLITMYILWHFRQSTFYDSFPDYSCDILETDLKYHTIYKWFACHFKIEILIKSISQSSIKMTSKQDKWNTCNDVFYIAGKIQIMHQLFIYLVKAYSM